MAANSNTIILSLEKNESNIKKLLNTTYTFLRIFKFIITIRAIMAVNSNTIQTQYHP